MVRAIPGGRHALFSVALALLALACSGGAPDGEGASTPAAGDSPSLQNETSQRYPEGVVTVSVKVLDTGLLKGDALAEASEGWRVTLLKVTATDPAGTEWAVLEFPDGVGSTSASAFFEVVVQELRRGDQLDIIAAATFEDDSGEQTVREAADRWPP